MLMEIIWHSSCVFQNISQKDSDNLRMDAAHTIKRRSRTLSPVWKEMWFLLLFCRQDVSQSLPSLIYLSPLKSHFYLVWFQSWATDSCLSFQRWGRQLNEKMLQLTAQSSICHDLYFAGASKTDKCVYYYVWEWAYVSVRRSTQDLSTWTLLLPFQPSSFPPSPCCGRSIHVGLKFTPWFLPRILLQKPPLNLFGSPPPPS